MVKGSGPGEGTVFRQCCLCLFFCDFGKHSEPPVSYKLGKISHENNSEVVDTKHIFKKSTDAIITTDINIENKGIKKE